MGPIGRPETLASNHRTSLLNIPEERRIEGAECVSFFLFFAPDIGTLLGKQRSYGFNTSW
jgi:hypothetical protein